MPFRPWSMRFDAGRRHLVPDWLALAPRQQFGCPDIAARADQRIATGELQSEPWDEGAAAFHLCTKHAVEPQRDLRQLERHRVQVDTEDVMVGEPHLHLLPLARIILMRDPPPGLVLLAVEVGVRELADSLVEKRRASHCGLADRELQNFVCGLILE